METLVQQFPNQLQEAITIGSKATLNPVTTSYRQVVISGLGGSGIGGTIVSQLVDAEANVPIIANKDYSIPGFVNEHTLVIISSYSGNTEETLEAFEKAMAKGAHIACITSGGKVGKLAEKHGLNHIIIPGGLPPRAAFGYSFAQLFFILKHYGVIQSDVAATLTAANNKLIEQQDAIKALGHEVATFLNGKMPVLYSDASTEGVAVRWRQQMNENSKMLCWNHVYPEMNHNELVGWTGKKDQLAVLFLRNEGDYTRTQKRMEVTRDTFARCTPHIKEVYSKGNNVIERGLYLIHLGDWTSVYLADLKGIDAMEVHVIDSLKEALARF